MSADLVAAGSRRLPVDEHVLIGVQLEAGRRVAVHVDVRSLAAKVTDTVALAPGLAGATGRGDLDALARPRRRTRPARPGPPAENTVLTILRSYQSSSPGAADIMGCLASFS
jgi:hypothetical protein